VQFLTFCYVIFSIDVYLHLLSKYVQLNPGCTYLEEARGLSCTFRQDTCNSTQVCMFSQICASSTYINKWHVFIFGLHLSSRYMQLNSGCIFLEEIRGWGAPFHRDMCNSTRVASFSNKYVTKHGGLSYLFFFGLLLLLFASHVHLHISSRNMQLITDSLAHCIKKRATRQPKRVAQQFLEESYI
jgi:hypothetical protein